jgi:trimeric autotransporter adhesin
VAARDLEAAPFNMDKQTAFTIADKLTFIGSGSVGQWYTCTCPSTSGGCAATNGYQRYLIADDDDGNLNNGTPHMTAIYAA